MNNKTIVVFAIVAAAALMISSCNVFAKVSEPASVRYTKGYNDGCSGQVVPGSHTESYLQGYAAGAKACYPSTAPQQIQQQQQVTQVIVNNNIQNVK